jgi:large subunit ribosomal protein L18
MSPIVKAKRRAKVRARVRKKVYGTAEKPRLSVFRSLSHIYAQIIDDDNGKTLAAVSSFGKKAEAEIKGKKKSDVSKEIGKLLAQKAKSNGIERVVFDRNGYRYHGRVQAFAEGAREGGLQF